MYSSGLYTIYSGLINNEIFYEFRDTKYQLNRSKLIVIQMINDLILEAMSHF